MTSKYPWGSAGKDPLVSWVEHYNSDLVDFDDLKVMLLETARRVDELEAHNQPRPEYRIPGACKTPIHEGVKQAYEEASMAATEGIKNLTYDTHERTRTMTPEETYPGEMLDYEIAQRIRKGYKIDFQTDTKVILSKGHRPSHVLHLILSLLTGGIWALFVWLPICIFGGERRIMLQVGRDGSVTGSAA